MTRKQQTFGFEVRCRRGPSDAGNELLLQDLWHSQVRMAGPLGFDATFLRAELAPGP
jgi:hypothetical protein